MAKIANKSDSPQKNVTKKTLSAQKEKSISSDVKFAEEGDLGPNNESAIKQDSLISNLEDEIKKASDEIEKADNNLLKGLEELANTNEELINSNKELISKNEELLSSNEKLKNSQDELKKQLEETKNELDKLITENKESDEALQCIEWMLANKPLSSSAASPADSTGEPDYGDLTEHNHDGIILKSVGKDVLQSITSNYMDLLGTSTAIVEKTGEFASRIVSSRWCVMMDRASRKLCATPDNAEAMNSGKWLCCESCMVNSTKVAIAAQVPVDTECYGGIRIYAEPIFAGEDIVGAINLGYGDPPTDLAKLQTMAASYGLDYHDLVREARNYDSRPSYIIELAKNRLHSSAKLLGSLIAHKIFEDDLQRLKEISLRAHVTKSEFAANMSYEIRTPMNSVMGLLQLLQTTELKAEQKQFVEEAITSTNNLLGIINDVIDLAKLDIRKGEIREEPFELREMMNSLPKLFAEQAQRKGIHLKSIIDSALPQIIIADELRIRRVLFNILENALQFTENGDIDIKVKRLNDRLHFVVSDTGIGMPKDLVKYIFEPLVQTDGSFTKRFKGSGFGLSIVRHLVELMNGSVGVESIEGKGTTVFFDIPFRTADKALATPIPLNEAKAAEHSSYKILLVEDDKTNRMVASLFLQKKGHTIILAQNGQECLDKLLENDVDIILMDIQMPVMNGIEATKEIRSNSAFKKKANIPIIALTAHANPGDRAEFIDAGMDDYLSKPINLKKLTEAIELLLQNKKSLM
ncbi:MAG: response regulator [Candidatus Riflebacteria bacterium]|nr:response regulator [Candidatus Riflebacteria bacterium]